MMTEGPPPRRPAALVGARAPGRGRRRRKGPAACQIAQPGHVDCVEALLHERCLKVERDVVEAGMAQQVRQALSANLALPKVGMPVAV